LTKNITVQLGASANVLITAADVNNGSTDNCGIKLLELDALFVVAMKVIISLPKSNR
jgi:hypothetical protein